MSNPKRKARYKRKLEREWLEMWHRPIGYFVIEDRNPDEILPSMEEITQSLIDKGATIFARYRLEVPVKDLMYPEMANKTFRYVSLVS